MSNEDQEPNVPTTRTDQTVTPETFLQAFLDAFPWQDDEEPVSGTDTVDAVCGLLALARDAEATVAANEPPARGQCEFETEDAAYVTAAKQVVARLGAPDGDLEVDDDADVSRGEDEGAYVMAWIWVRQSDLEDAA